MATTKRARLKEENSKEEREPKLKCHEMRLIFQRLPTSELVRFISRLPKHPLGKFWSQELKFAVEKRLPFSIKAKTTARGLPSDHVIFDCNGSRVAEIKRPKQFYLSPICELIESAEVQAIARTKSSLPPRVVFPTSDILLTLTNMDTLAISVHYFAQPAMRSPVDLSTALSAEVMSRIKSLRLANLPHGYERVEKPISDVLTRATNLKKLSMSHLAQSTQTLFAELPSATEGASGLESLSILNLSSIAVKPQPLLQIITSRFNGLRVLVMSVQAPIREYLAAFQSLPSLTTLGLAMSQSIDDYNDYDELEQLENEFSVDENDAPVVSVTELFITWSFSVARASEALLEVLSKFPNVRSFGADFQDSASYLLNFASTVCSTRVITQLQALKLFCNASIARDALLSFVRDNIDYLPNTVDLSQFATDRPRTVDRDFLVDLCLALQGGRVTSLALKDLVHRDAVSLLREHFALGKEEPKVGNVFAWIDEGSIDERRIRSRAAWWPEAVSDFTDFRVEACKTSGPLKGSTFKVRVSNWTEKRKRLFGDKLVLRNDD